MKMRSTCAGAAAIAVCLAGVAAVPTQSGATSLAAKDASPSKGSRATPRVAAPTKDEIVAMYVSSCLAQPAKEEECGKIRKAAVEIVKEDLHTLGSSANRPYMPTILKIFKNDEVELRIAAADAAGMIGPQDQDVDAIIPMTNDPVPDVRHAIANMLRHGKGSAIALLKERTNPMRTGLTPDKPADAAKFAMPVVPDSVYLFDSSDVARGRLSYVARSKSDPTQFLRPRLKRGRINGKTSESSIAISYKMKKKLSIRCNRPKPSS